MKYGMRTLVILLVLAILGYGTWQWLMLTAPSQSAQREGNIDRPEWPKVQVRVLQKPIYHMAWFLYGQCFRDHQIKLTSPQQTQVIKLSVEAGSLVKRGQPLLQLDARKHELNLKQAQITLQEHQAQYHYQHTVAKQDQLMVDNAKSHYRWTQKKVERYRKLQQQDALSIQALETLLQQAEQEHSGLVQAQHKQQASQQQITLWQARVESSKLAVEKARIDLDSLTITAPFDGVIESVQVNDGDDVGLGQHLMTLSHQTWKVKALMPYDKMADLAQQGVSVHQLSAQVSLAGLPKIPLNHIQIRAEETWAQLGMVLTAKLDSRSLKKPLFQSGQTATIILKVPIKHASWVVPPSSLVLSKYLYIIQDNRVQQVPISLHGFDEHNGWPVVSSPSLKPGVVVVEDIPTSLTEGQQVRVSS
ncbi:MAG: biotin/lipoyl-binding protein [Pseudomonadota bacterium]|nr:biotin/lipoyl-binding protein [Pseudomonadota bacterium]